MSQWWPSNKGERLDRLIYKHVRGWEGNAFIDMWEVGQNYIYRYVESGSNQHG